MTSVFVADRYFDAPTTSNSELLAATSKGQYFCEAIRGAFAYEPIALE